MALNAAFLRKFGVSATEAVAQGAIDGVSGFLVQVAIMIIVLIGGDVDFHLDIDTTDAQWLLILAAVVGPSGWGRRGGPADRSIAEENRSSG